MSSWNRWRVRLSVVLGAVALSVFVPVAAWAASGIALDGRPKGGFSGFDCCLGVVGVVAVLVVIIIREGRNRRPPS
ncbi:MULTISPECIES: hypothetical protein [unclassified Micromonospora]|uniref:hypothetical protein n=1 Tax=unclassified Micromonospora TaxID=2617518 RepID=UPI001B3995EC|nr:MULTISPECIES: hypothetical protein [unclassified Micromonospora]MBQ1046425.1 hypothetical protein [Micromonospora sp. C72]MBQ1058698.1 hypothetical protein [Micromonospora sp. C32]